MRFHHFSYISDGGTVGTKTLPADPPDIEAMREVVSLIRREGGRFVLSASDDRRSLIERRRTSLVCDFNHNGREEKLQIGDEWDESLAPVFAEATSVSDTP